MKRDMDLCREILIQIEEQEEATGWVDLVVEGHSYVEVAQHVRLLQEAGLIEAQNLTTHSGFDWKPKRLTWAGHEFLSAARNEGIWQKTKAIVLEKTGTLTLELLKVGLTQVTKAALTGQL